MSSGPSRPSEWLRLKGAEVFARDAARRIHEQLDKWLALKDIAQVKWVWELIQNARDVAKEQNKENLKVSFVLDKNQLVFEHDAGPFSLDDIGNLINSRSDKPLESPELMGQFGKGFLVTHILSAKVSVRGWVRDDARNINKTFKLLLDRSIQENDELTVEHITHNIENCCEQLDNPGPPQKKDITQFEYLLDKQGHDAAVIGLVALEDVLPFVLAFSEPKITVKIIRYGQTSVYKVTKKKTLRSKPIRIELLRMNDRELDQGNSLIIVSSIDSKVRIAVPFLSSDQAILEPGDISRLFKMFPLAKTRDIVLPVVIDAPFRVSLERFDIQYRDDRIMELKDILQTSTSLLKELCIWALDNNIKHKELLFKINAPRGRPHEEQWIQALYNFVKDISQLRVVETVKEIVDDSSYETEFLKPESVYFPSPLVRSYSFDNEKFLSAIWWLSYHLGLRVPAQRLVDEWNDIRVGWGSLGITIGNDQTFESLVKEIEKLQNLVNLRKKASIATDKKALTFLKYLYKLSEYYCSEGEHTPGFLIGSAIYCNQKGEFKKPRELDIDQNIPEDLKRISDGLLESFRDRLLNTEFSKDEQLLQYFRTLRMDIINEKKAIDLLYDSILKNWKRMSKSIEIDTNKYKQAVVDFEKWLLKRGDFKTLLNDYTLKELPFLCEDNKLRMVEEECFLLPDLFLESDAQEYTDIWPNETKLSKMYSEGISEPAIIKERLVTAGIGQPRLFFMEEMEFSLDRMREMSDATIRVRGDYRATTMVSKVVAFNKMLENAQLSMDPKFTKAILNFVLDYLVPRDDFWQNKTVRAIEMTRPALGIPVPTGKERCFQIRPCQWLVEMKQYSWVIRASQDDEGKLIFDAEVPSKRSLMDYIKDLEPLILSDEKVQMFLQIFEFDPLEVTAWLLTGGKEQILVESLKQIHQLADSQGIAPMSLFSEICSEVWRRSSRVEIANRNRNFGLIIENIVRKVFEQLKFREYGFLVIPRWKGCDFEAYLQRKATEEFDYGTLSIKFQRIKDREILERFEVEVKATKIDTVTMTLAQANSAVDNIERYLLCIVNAKEFIDDFKELEYPSITKGQIEKLSKKILPYMRIIKIGQELKQIVTELRKAGSAATPDIRVDYKARFTIQSKLWITKGETIIKWFNSILHLLGISTD